MPHPTDPLLSSCLYLGLITLVVATHPVQAGPKGHSQPQQCSVYEQMTARLPQALAPTRVVAQTLIQYALHQAYKQADRELCDQGWTLRGEILDSAGPDLQRYSTPAQPPVWTLITRRSLVPWTCNVSQDAYLASVRSFLPDWISLDYVSDPQTTTAHTFASLE